MALHTEKYAQAASKVVAIQHQVVNRGRRLAALGHDASLVWLAKTLAALGW